VNNASQVLCAEATVPLTTRCRYLVTGRCAGLVGPLQVTGVANLTSYSLGSLTASREAPHGGRVPHILKTRALPRDRADGATVRVVTTLNGAPNHGWWLVLVVFLFKGIPIAT